MFNKYKPIIVLLIAVVLIGGASLSYSYLSNRFKETNSNSIANSAGNSTTNATSNSGTPATDFVAYLDDGTAVHLSDYFGKPIVLNFWASWCPPCKAEMPTFNGMYPDVSDDVQFLMVDMVDGERETVKTGQNFIASKGYTFPVLYDTDGNAANAYSVRSIPTTYFIDNNGNIISQHTGMIDAIKLQSGIESIKK